MNAILDPSNSGVGVFAADSIAPVWACSEDVVAVGFQEWDAGEALGALRQRTDGRSGPEDVFRPVRRGWSSQGAGGAGAAGAAVDLWGCTGGVCFSGAGAPAGGSWGVVGRGGVGRARRGGGAFGPWSLAGTQVRAQASKRKARSDGRRPAARGLAAASRGAGVGASG